MAATPLRTLLARSDTLARLHDHAQHLNRLQRLVEAALPSTLAGRVLVANSREGCLTLHVQSPAAATRLKLGLDSLRGTLLASGEPVGEIQVKVRLSRSPGLALPPAGTARHISENGKAALRSLQASLQPDDPLTAALRRLIDEAGPSETQTAE